MPDREKVVRAVETCFDSWIDKHRNMGLDLHEVERMKHDALELLKEQEPVEPKISNTAIPVSKTAVRFVKTYWCGACGEAINQSDAYCRKCGQAVKWDD